MSRVFVSNSAISSHSEFVKFENLSDLHTSFSKRGKHYIDRLSWTLDLQTNFTIYKLPQQSFQKYTLCSIDIAHPYEFSANTQFNSLSAAEC